MQTNKNLLPKQFVKIIVKKFVNITSFLKKLMILFKRNKM